MKSSTGIGHIPEAVETVARELVRPDQFDTAKVNYQNWNGSLPAQTSTINHRLYFLELLEQAAENTNLKDNEELVASILDDSGIRQVGDLFDRVDQYGEKKTWKVIWRKIGTRYGIEMGLKSEDGELRSGEFFD
jgi:hypothetical protein